MSSGHISIENCWWLESPTPCPEAPALLAADGSVITRQHLTQAVAASQAFLQSQGIGRQHRLALVMAPGTTMATSLLGAMATAAVAPLVSSSPVGVLVDDLQRLRITQVLVDDEPSAAMLEAAAQLKLPLLRLDPFGLPDPGGNPGPCPQPSDLALLLQTSGTTSRPKVVPLSHGNLLASAWAISEVLALGPKDRCLAAMPLFHIHGIVATLLAPLLAGGSLICSAPTSSEQLLGQLSALEATWLSASPTLLAALLAEQERQKRARPPHLRLLRSVTLSLPPVLRQRLEAVFQVPVLEVYGMTEAASQICSQGLPGGGVAHRPSSVGPAAGPEVAVLSSSGEHQPPGVIGEIAIRGPSVTSGYEGSITSGWIQDVSGVHWFQTGDEGFLDAQGHLSLIGRSKEMINRGGMKVIPRRVDEALEAHPAVLEGLAFAIPHPTRGEDLAAAVVIAADVTVLEQELRDHLAQLLPAQEVPSRIVQVETLPRGTTGKPLRSALAEQLSSSIHPASTPADGPIEQLIAATFAAVLDQRQPARRDDNFFLLGGDSLSSLRVIHRLEQQLDLELSATLLFRHPSVQNLARHLAPLLAKRGGSISSLQSLSEPDAKLLQLKNADGAGSFPSAESLPGDWPQHCLAFPASYAQTRLWFLHQLQPDLTAYHLPALWRLSGNLDLKALRLALADLIERHPTLRTSLRLQGSEVVQIIHPPTPFHLDPEPLADCNPDAVIEQWMEQERTTPFDLATGQLLRARLLAVDHQHHLLLLNHHHIASDGWSLSVLARDLTDLYNARLTGQASELAPLQVQYHDYAAWQRQRLSGDRRQSLKDYWIPQLTGLEPLELPSDHPRPATPSHRGGSVAFQITPELLAPFEQLCSQEGATLQMGLVALLALLLHRYSRQEDFAIGVPIWGRNHPDLEPLIGFFVNTLPVRTRFTPEQSFRQLLQQVKASCLASYDHQQLPFEQMVEALNLPRDTSRNPLVQVMLQLIELPKAYLHNLQGLAVESLEARNGAARFDLEFFLRRSADGLKGEIAYATELFSTDRIERLCSYLLTLLSSAVGAPDSQANSLCLLPDAESQLIESWQNGPTIDVPDLCVHQLFEQQVERTPDAIALIFEDQQLTYQELNARANQLAHHLIDLGVGPEVIVGVCLERSVELIVSLLAILKAGGAYLPLDPSSPPERLQMVLSRSETKLTICTTATSKRFGCSGIQIDPEETNQQDRKSSQVANPGKSYGLDSLAYVLFTSGTTGQPKGVASSHRVLANLVTWQATDERLRRPAKTLQFAASLFDVSLQEIFTTLCSGGQLLVVNKELRFDLDKISAIIAENQVERIFLPYAALEHIASCISSHSATKAYSLLDIVSAGEKLALTQSICELINALPNCRLHNHYGPTEAHVVSSQSLKLPTAHWPLESSIGSPIGNVHLHVLTPAGQPCPIGFPGELHIGGAGLARGYLNNPELTAEKFIPDPFSADPTARLYKSGDLASWYPDGTLAFHGRIDQQIKLRGFRIEPGEIEANLLSHPDVGQVAVLLSHDDHNNSRLIAYWVADASQETTASASSEQLRSFLAERLPDYMVPAALLQLEALPLTPNGKLDRKALPAPSFSGNLEQRVAASTDLEHQLHGIWAEVLGHSDFGITDNFFVVGGHSLAAASLVSRMEKAIGISISLAKLFQSPTILGLVDQLGDEKGKPQENALCCLVPLQPLGSRPPLFIVPGWGGGLVFEQGACLLAPHQPVYGLRVMGDPASIGEDGFEAIISKFADLIVDFWQQGDICLMSYSVGGWYAHALAAELLRRGRKLGTLVIIDTVPNVRISRSLGTMLLLDRLSQVRLWTLMRNLVREPTLEKRRAFVRGKMRTLKQAIEALTGLRIPRPRVGLAKAMPSRARQQTDFYVDLVWSSYRPCPLPVRVALLATPLTAQRYKRLWRHYAAIDLQVFCCLGKHLDVLRSDVQSKLAPLIVNILTGQQDGSH